MRVRAVGDNLSVLVGQNLRGKFLDVFGRDVQRAGDVRFAITFWRERLDHRDLFLVKFGFQVFGRNCAVHFDFLGKHSSSMREEVSPIRVRNSCGGLAFNSRLVGALETRFGNICHSVATAETTGYARSSRRAFDSQQRCRLR